MSEQSETQNKLEEQARRKVLTGLLTAAPVAVAGVLILAELRLRACAGRHQLQLLDQHQRSSEHGRAACGASTCHALCLQTSLARLLG